MKLWIGFLFSLFILFTNSLFAANPTINLTLDYQSVNFTGKPATAISVNHQIPAPTLHFKQGDTVTINVSNHLHEETALHWHGLLIPWQMDGVKGITQRGIQPGETFTYQFKLNQSGTYWYHAHAGLQEQQGVYGGFIIDPLTQPNYHYTKDYTIVLSDWRDTNPSDILANLKKSGDYYQPSFPLQASLMKFIHDYSHASTTEKPQVLDDYQQMQQMRMGIYDFSDVAYQSFLLNGHTKQFPWKALVNKGDIVRLRLIGAGGSTQFHVKIPGQVAEMIHVEGNDVKPYRVNDFMISPGETYDVLVRVNDAPVIIYAESSDKVGMVYGALITSPNQKIDFASVTQFNNPLPVTREMMDLMMANSYRGELPGKNKIPKNKIPMRHEMPNTHKVTVKHDMPMNHSMSMPTEASVFTDSISPPNNHYQTTKGTKYDNVVAEVATNNPSTPIAGVINMELFGYMDKYIWFVNGVPEHMAKPIVLQPGKRYRFVFTNTSMMHHPMHLHGHWFILRKGHGAYDPLLHTIDIPPGATITADVDTDASGQWLFHCHLLYHMMSGMSRVFQYSTVFEMLENPPKGQSIEKQTQYHNRPIVRVDDIKEIDPVLIHHPMAHHTGMWFANTLDAGVDVFHNRQNFTFKGLYGYDYDKLELFANDVEVDNNEIKRADIDIFYWHLLNQFWMIKGGVNYVYRPSYQPYWQPGVGLEGLLPYFIDVNLRGYYHDGGVKFDVELMRDVQITNNFFLGFGIESILATKAVDSAALGSGLNEMRYIVKPYYRLAPGLNAFIEYEYEVGYGGYRQYLLAQGEAKSDNIVTIGLSALF